MAVTSTMNWTPVVLTIAGFFILKDLLDKDDDEADEQATKDLEDFKLINNPFAYSVFQVPPKKEGMYRMRINTYGIPIAAARIDKGLGILYDKEDVIMGGVKLAGTKSDIAVIARFMNSKYGYDVYEKMKKNLSSAELGRINRYVSKLPDYSKTGSKV